jgi:anti-sigma factor RsiW
MTTHLSDEQLTEVLLGSANEETAGHVRDCAACRAEAGDIREMIAEYTQLARAQADARVLPPINVSRKQVQNFSPQRLSWVASFALLAVAVFMLMMTPSPRRPVSAPVQDADDALLVDIQEDLAREVPEALEPAAALAAERNRVIAHVQGKRTDR